MSHGEISRRDFLCYGAAATAAASLAGPTVFGVEIEEAPTLRVMLRDSKGKPLPEAQAKTIIARDLHNDPLPLAIRHYENECHITLGSEPFQLACELAVPGFGQVYCYADNDGRGYSRPGVIEFVIDAARTRVRRVRDAFKASPRSIRSTPLLERFLAAAGRPIPDEAGPAQTAAAYESLARGLIAGERISLLSAQDRISRLSAPRQDFLFGGMIAGRDRSPNFAELFTKAFNFATISWYTWKQQPDESAPVEYPRMDASLQWCLDRHIIPKGFGYVYLTKGAMPEWLRDWPYEKMLPLYKRVVEQTMRRYAGRLPFAEIINEAHDKSNLPHFNHAQIVELTREACLSARQGSPTVKRQINNCCLWAEYAKNRNKDGSRRWSPYRYIADCVKSNVEFERIGLQLYYPRQDLFEIERMLARFKDFGRPLHISEISCNSAPGLDPDSMRPNEEVPGWHGPWTERTQADWLEAIYTLCYSKPEFEAIGWWDIADYPGHFWPHGGLLRADSTPKESYFRLLTLKRNWGLTA